MSLCTEKRIVRGKDADNKEVLRMLILGADHVYLLSSEIRDSINAW